MSLRGGLFLRRVPALVRGDSVCSFSVCFCFPFGCRGMASPCHGTRPHAGLRDIKKKKKKKSPDSVSILNTREAVPTAYHVEVDSGALLVGDSQWSQV